MTKSPHTLLDEIVMPAPSPGFAHLFQLLRDDVCSAFELEAQLRLDASLAAEILRVANSARYGRRRQVGTIREAVTLLGRRQLLDIILGTGMSRVTPDFLHGYGVSAAAFLEHSVATALLAEDLAVQLGRARPEEVFTAALLHDFGKVAVSRYLSASGLAPQPSHEPGSGFGADRADGAGICECVSAEGAPGDSNAPGGDELAGVDHARVGACVADRWHLPDLIAIVAEWHHAPLGAGRHQDAVGIVHVADFLAHSVGYGGDPAADQKRVDREVLDLVGATTRQLERALAATLPDIRELTRLMTRAQGGPDVVRHSHR